MRKDNLRGMEVGNDGVAVIRILNPPVNALAPPILAGLKEKYAEAMSRNDVKAIVLTGEGGRFSGGFDISVLELVHQTGDISKLPDVSVQLVCSIIEDAKKPSVVDIEGLALGEELLTVARRWALDISERRKPWISSLQKTSKLGSLAESHKVIQAAREQAKRTAPNMPQHQACLDAVEEGIVFGGYSGVLKEVKLFNELVLSDTSRGLVHFFFSQRAISKEIFEV
ncbi:hypothetical protein MKW98_011907 [Papaver atlanticum]|uniref:Uncharacterized protein n=1 Tax=Papaver atlanticum TaxID=357466 RepID=A0AAD4T732_9MAGN|nr:hypothetical protein MKW98_011907 [Papaver atlanticum]